MKIAFVSPWDTLSGTALGFRHLVGYLVKDHKINMKVFCEHDSSDIPNITVPKDIPYEKAWSRRDKRLLELKDKIEAYDPDIIQLVHELNWFGLDVRLKEFFTWTNKKGYKTIFHFQSPHPTWMGYIGSLNCDAYIDNCFPENEIVYSKIGLPDKVHFISHGVIQGDLIDKETARKELKLDKYKNVFITTGFMRQAVGVKDIVEGVGRVMQKFKETALIIAGRVHYDERNPLKYKNDGEEMADFFGVKEEVIFTNKFHSEKELSLLGSASDVYINYRKYYPFFFVGGSVFRSFSFEVPLVAYDHPSIDYIPKGMLRIRNTKELSEALEALITNKSLYQKLQKESKEMKKEWSYQEKAKEYLKVYNSLME